MTNLYSPKQVQEMLEVSATGLRIYTSTYPNYLSTEATGKRRKFTEADLCFLSFVKARTEAGDNHKDVLAMLGREEGKAQWEQFQSEWEPLEPPDDTDGPHADPGTVLVPMAQLQAARLLLEDAQRREQESREQATAMRQEALQRERELQERINQLQRELGKVEGALGKTESELATLKAMQQATPPERPKSWWARWFDGGE
jgi:DNA-binding transcriptional MerR regulator